MNLKEPRRQFYPHLLINHSRSFKYKFVQSIGWHFLLRHLYSFRRGRNSRHLRILQVVKKKKRKLLRYRTVRHAYFFFL